MSRNFAEKIDHTLLKATATKDDILKLCKEAADYQFFSVCVNPIWVSTAKKALEGTDVRVCTVVGFPLGASPASVKAFETKQAIAEGADEIDMVIPIGAFLSGDNDTTYTHIAAVKEAAGDRIVKVILETSYLTDEDIVQGCELSVKAGADFVKTSTGFSDGGATLKHVSLMKGAVREQAKVKASGGIRDRQTMQAMVEVGADRVGASASVAIVTSS
ncbi:deoxyribose-phosphate aldolase [Bacillaceae bacterium SIJ1]|uniref:deoxyribose-phosphate aldolase n=1 Tax=Litoribacterium kuwaitense TaxID=1398745 RepID=UPI0013ECC95A|nr:deoxyribose-phosphate aldolase [Litoribacterium kuwaitense]NGP43513.1 deoxyribose-phosphate aldolase [Litoribacterium kuwaitense]